MPCPQNNETPSRPLSTTPSSMGYCSSFFRPATIGEPRERCSFLKRDVRNRGNGERGHDELGKRFGRLCRPSSGATRLRPPSPAPPLHHDRDRDRHVPPGAKRFAHADCLQSAVVFH